MQKIFIGVGVGLMMLFLFNLVNAKAQNPGHFEYIAAGEKNDWGKILGFRKEHWSLIYNNNNMRYFDINLTQNHAPPYQIAAGFRASSGEIHGSYPWQEQSVLPKEKNRIHFKAVACPTLKRCFAVGHISEDGLSPAESVIYQYRHPQGWVLQAKIFQNTRLVDIDCPSHKACYALSHEGVIYQNHQNQKAWVAITSLLPKKVHAISCEDEWHCRIVGEKGHIYRLSHLMLTQEKGLPNNIKFNGIFCKKNRPCLAVGGEGSIYQLDKGRWLKMSAPGKMNLQGVFCHGKTDCMAVGLNSDVGYHYLNGAWHETPLGGRYNLYAISGY
jgi:hypothetical protein